MKFSELSLGETFVFASERDERFRFSGMERGPWVKVTASKYVPWSGNGTGEPECRVGTASVGVVRLTHDQAEAITANH